MTPNELRQLIADALDGAAERLRAGIVTGAEPERMADRPPIADPVSDVTERVLRVDDVARLLGVSTWSVYEAIKAGEMSAIRVGRRTHRSAPTKFSSTARHVGGRTVSEGPYRELVDR